MVELRPVPLRPGPAASRPEAWRHDDPSSSRCGRSRFCHGCCWGAGPNREPHGHTGDHPTGGAKRHGKREVDPESNQPISRCHTVIREAESLQACRFWNAHQAARESQREGEPIVARAIARAIARGSTRNHSGHRSRAAETGCPGPALGCEACASVVRCRFHPTDRQRGSRRPSCSRIRGVSAPFGLIGGPTCFHRPNGPVPTGRR